MSETDGVYFPVSQPAREYYEKRIAELEEISERDAEGRLEDIRIINSLRQENAAQAAEIERLQKCCSQRGARMQIMKRYLDKHIMISFRTEENAQIDEWFDDKGVPLSSTQGGG